jgi:hypothetical protein
MNKKVIKLTESDLVRLVEKVISEQAKQDPTGKTINLYSDNQQKSLLATAKIELVKKRKNNDIEIVVSSEKIGGAYSGKASLIFSCSSPSGRFTFQGANPPYVYNKQLGSLMTNLYCQKGSGGQRVPKADFASTDDTDSDFT